MLRNCDDAPDRALVFAAELTNSRAPHDDLLPMQQQQQNDRQVWETKSQEMENVEGRLRIHSPRTHGDMAPRSICKRIEILLDKDSSGEGFGFVLRGGAYCDSDGSSPLIVTKIIPGSSADREGTLQVGDRIIEINGLDTSRVTVKQAATMLNEAENDVILLIEYDTQVLEWISNAAGPIVVEIEKPVGKVLDITLSSTTWNGVSVVYIDSVYEAGTADRSGAMHVGDHVMRIDGIPLGRRSVDEATTLLQSNKTERIQLEIFPISAQVNAETMLCSPHKATTTVLASTGLPSYDSSLLLEFETALISEAVSSSDDLSSCSTGQRFQQVSYQGSARRPPPSGSRSLTTLRGYTPPLQMVTPRSVTPPNNFHLRSFSPHSLSHHPIRGRASPNSSLSPTRSATPPVAFGVCKRVASSSLGGLPNTGPGVPARTPNSFRKFSRASLNHVDIAEVVLFGSPDGFGLDIEAVTGDDLTANGSSGVNWPMVTRLETRSEADRSGVLQEGDRVLAINGQSLRGRTNEDIQRMLGSSSSSSSSTLRLLIEFDVADSIVVSSGTILVKLVKGGGLGLGLSLAYPEKRTPGDPLIISDIKKGSVAHRVGAIRVGDALLAVDEADVIDSSVEHVTKMLLNCSDIVQLTIRKNESAAETTRSGLVTFSVELPVQAGSQLGVILSTTSGSVCKRIIVSDIVEGSLLQRSGALRVGDEVVSINGIPVDGRCLDDAQRILSESSQSVSLKIKRLPAESNALVSSRSGQKAQNSVDSAVESCDSSSTPNSDTAASQDPTPRQPLRVSSPHFPPAPPHHLPRPHHQLLRKPRSCNELKITAEIHSFTEDVPPPPVMTPADLSPQHSMDNRLPPVGGVPSEDDEWSRRLDDLDNDTVYMDDCLGRSFSPLPTNIKVGDVTNRSDMTSQPCSVKSGDDADRKDADFGDCNCGKTEDKANRSIEAFVSDGLVEPMAVQTRNWNRNDVFSAIETDSPEVDVGHALLNTSGVSQPETDRASQKTRVTEAVLPGIELTALEGKDVTAMTGELNQLEELLESIFTPTPVELLKVVLYKVRSTDDFGFSLSDGVYEKGVYVSGVRPRGPASDGLLPYDKILQINQVKTKDLDSHQVVPLIAEAGNRVELIVCRNALATSLPRDRSRDNAGAPRGPRAGSSPPQSGSTLNPSSKVDPLWKPRVRRKVNFLSKNSVF